MAKRIEPSDSIEDIKRVSKELVIVNRAGMHTRPVVAFVKTCEKFQSEIVVEIEKEKFDGRSLLEWMARTTVVKGVCLTIHAIGDDAQEVIEALTSLVDNGFDEV